MKKNIPGIQYGTRDFALFDISVATQLYRHLMKIFYHLLRILISAVMILPCKLIPLSSSSLGELDYYKFLQQFFDFLEWIGDPTNKVDLYGVQSWITSDCIVESNAIVLSKDLDGFVSYLQKMRIKYEKVSYSTRFDNTTLCHDKATIHFHVLTKENTGLIKNLYSIADITFKNGKICYWKEVFCDLSSQNQTNISLYHSYEDLSCHHDLYPISSSISEGYLPVSTIHTLFYATYGNPRGIPVVILHGGPGEGCSKELTRFFDLNRFYVIMFDQRGSNKSLPFASLEENTPHHSVEDIEILRKHLGIETWLVFGGSWGSTLAILYGQSYPEHCKGFILRGIFLGRKQDYLHLLYDMGKISPKAYDKFLHFIPEEERSDLLTAYYNRVMNPCPEIYLPAARSFLEFDATCVRFSANAQSIENALKNDHNVYCVAKHFLYYSKHQFFLEPNHILSQMNKIKHIPAVIIHGKYDIVTLPENAYTLHQTWDNSVLWMTSLGGHSSLEKANASALATALDLFADQISGKDPE